MARDTVVRVVSQEGKVIIPKVERWCINLLPRKYEQIFVQNFAEGPYTIQYFLDDEMIQEDEVEVNVQVSDNDHSSIEERKHIFGIVREGIKKY
jgi:hypothetical protein